MQQFGRSGFNCDVMSGNTILKITTTADDAGGVVRLARAGFDQRYTVRRTQTGTVELADAGGVMVPMDAFLVSVGEGCGQPIRVVQTVPEALARFAERLQTAVVSTGRDKGWQVTTFGKVFSADVSVGSLMLKITTDGAWVPDGSGPIVKLSRAGFDRALPIRMGRDGKLELSDEQGQRVSIERFVAIVAEGCGTAIEKVDDIPPALIRFYEKLGGTVVRAAQDLGWNARLFGSRGFNTDLAVGPNIAKITTDAKSQPDGTGATVWIKRPGYERALTTRMSKDGELEMVDGNGGKVSLERFIELCGEATNTPIPKVEEVPLPFARFTERVQSALVSTGNDNGWKVTLFGQTGINADVTIGRSIVKVTTRGKTSPDGSGPTVSIGGTQPRSLTLRPLPDGELELVDGAASVPDLRFVGMIAEACNAPLKTTSALPPALERFNERLASTTGTAANDNGWKLTAFGKQGYNADLSVGRNSVKVTSEGQPLADGTGTKVRLKSDKVERVFTTRLGSDSELELVEESGRATTFDAFAALLKAAF